MKIKLDDGAFMPVRAHDADAGLDLRAKEDSYVWAGRPAVFDTGVHVEIPFGFYGKIESKSGLNVKNGIVSCGGVIDSGYTGSIVVKLYNFGDEAHFFKAGDKIAQLIIQPCVAPTLEIVDDLVETERGDNGFGSSGA